MKIPRNVKIGPYTYSVGHEAEPETSEGKFSYGYVIHNKQTIVLRRGLPADQEGDTFLHECIHAIDNYMDTKLDESQIRRLASGLYALLKDNCLLRDR